MWRTRLKEINRSNGSILKWLAISYLTFGIFLLVVSIDPVIVGDGSDRWAVVEALLIGSKIPPIKYSIIQPILSLPLAYVGPLVGVTSFQSVAYFNILIIGTLGGLLHGEYGQSTDMRSPSYFQCSFLAHPCCRIMGNFI